MIKEQDAIGKLDQYELHIPINVQMDLEEEICDREDIYGLNIKTAVFVEGVRPVFHHFLGFPVVYEAKKFELVKK